METYENTDALSRTPNQFIVQEDDNSDNYYEELSIHEGIENVRYVSSTSKTTHGLRNVESPKVHCDGRKVEEPKAKSKIQERQTFEHSSTVSQRNNCTKWKVLFVILLLLCTGLTSSLVYFIVKEFSHTPCTPEPCLNGGQCFISGEDYNCFCPRGFYGSQCENTPCSDQPCLHNGTCTVWQHTYYCSCPVGYSGTKCEETPCTRGQCFNGGQCSIDKDDYRCICPKGFNGQKCQNDPCKSSPCLNDGTCVVNNNDFKCHCACGFVGDRCQDYRCASGDQFTNCKITQDTSDDYDWRYHSGPTGSSKTGPSSAFEGSYYYYFETSSPVSQGSKAKLILKTRNSGKNVFLSGKWPGTEKCIKFHYHMYGSDMGSLMCTKDHKRYGYVLVIRGIPGSLPVLTSTYHKLYLKPSVEPIIRVILPLMILDLELQAVSKGQSLNFMGDEVGFDKKLLLLCPNWR